MKKVIIIGANGSLAQNVIKALQKTDDVKLTLFARSSITPKLSEGISIVKADVMDYENLKNAIAGQDIVYVNLAGNLFGSNGKKYCKGHAGKCCEKNNCHQLYWHI